MKSINQYIDHTNLGLKTKKEDIVKLCKEAIEYKFKAVCISPNHVWIATKELINSNVLVCTVIGFPNGYQTTLSKKYEIEELITYGAQELDIVVNLQDISERDYSKIEKELYILRKVTNKYITKLIIEASLLTKKEIEILCEIGCKTKMDFIKTSTGFNGKASLENVRVMKKIINNRAKIKAAGGIRSFDDALKYINLGVSRIGTSSGVKIVERT